MQKGRSCNAIGPATPEARRIHRAGIAANDVVSAAARIVEIEDSELSVIEDIEKLRPKLNFAGLLQLNLL
jgi:hypothetical protein